MHHTPNFHLVLSRPSLHNLNCAIRAFHARLRVTTEDPSTSQPSKQCLHTLVCVGSNPTSSCPLLCV